MNDLGKNEVKTWNSLLGGEVEEGIGFYNSQDYAWVPDIEANWKLIRAEVDEFLVNHKNRIKPYFSKKLVTGPKAWKAFSLQFWGWRFSKNIKECPETMRLLQAIPGLIGASISMIEPHHAIQAHRGDTNAVFRCHLGLHIPGSLPLCGFESSGEQRS
jgi:aspartyl/asparaginyl beta-hydroxylase (cupin superfamily)